MNTPLFDALVQLNLQPGDTQRMAVNGHVMEVRCVPEEEQPPRDEAAQAEETSVPDNGGMLLPWVWFPNQGPSVPIILYPAPQVLPDPPEIPREDERA